MEILRFLQLSLYKNSMRLNLKSIEYNIYLPQSSGDSYVYARIIWVTVRYMPA